MNARFNPLDPLGILEPIRKDIERLLPLKLPKTIGNPIPIEFDGRLVDIKTQARQTLIDRGYQPRLVDKALNWYDGWLMGMARRLAPGNTELQRSVVQSAYEEVASKAESWMRGIQAAFALEE